MPYLSQFPPAPTMVPVPGGHGHVPDPSTAGAAGQMIPGPAAWPYTGGISQCGTGPGPVGFPVSRRR